MAKNENSNKEYYSIDLVHVFSTLVKRVWVIILTAVLGAIIGFSVTAFMITPTYSAEIMLYVNNSSISVGGANFSISSSEITAAQSLVKTYIVMLKNKTTLDKVIEEAGVDYTYEELYPLIEARSVNDTEVLKVVVTTDDPYEAAKIANCIAKVLPSRISEIIEGSSMKVVDSAVVDLNKVAPSVTKGTAVGGVFGLILAVVVLAIMAISDDTIHDEDYILQNYKYPILAKVPDLMSSDSKEYGYYKQSN